MLQDSDAHVMGASELADWSPEKYLTFAEERALPAKDLIARIPNRTPKLIYDLGCGPGNSTLLLQAAFPDARITAIDSSPAMIAKAKISGAQADFQLADVATWKPDSTADIVFSNALFQWVPQHEKHLLRIVTAMKPGAVLAVQMPDNLAEPSHRLMAETARHFLGKMVVDQILAMRSSLLESTGYIHQLSSVVVPVDVWRTTYHNRLKGHCGIADMYASTGLKPWLEAIDRQYADEFLSAYVNTLAQHYSTEVDGSVIYSFPRLFILAVRS